MEQRVVLGFRETPDRSNSTKEIFYITDYNITYIKSNFALYAIFTNKCNDNNNIKFIATFKLNNFVEQYLIILH